MSEHTPGPWKVESSTDRYGRTSYAIVEVFNPEKPEEEANRQLIETAPDLLEALEDMLTAIEIISSSVPDIEVSAPTALTLVGFKENALQSIAKAKEGK